jgi:5-methylcytosine-specific restriction enzyme subunit McrC
MSSKEIPIRNIWLLMLYASDLYQLPQVRNSGVDENPDKLPDLISEILCDAVEHRLHRNLSTGFRLRRNNLTRVRGRILLLETERKMLLDRGKVACEFESLTIDTFRNRYVLSALENCVRRVKDKKLSSRCRSNISTLRSLGVSDQKPTKWELNLDQFTRNDSQDRPMVSAARFANEMSIPNEEGGAFLVGQPGRDERWLRGLFEKAIAGFYKVVATQRGWRVYPGKWLNWPIDDKSSRVDEFLPKMKTDIYLVHTEGGRTVIIDTKFTSILKPTQYREATFSSGYIYQIYTYIRSQKPGQSSGEDFSTGILLHPSIGQHIDESVTIQGDQFRFVTVDLSETAQVIKNRLASLLEQHRQTAIPSNYA